MSNDSTKFVEEKCVIKITRSTSASRDPQKNKLVMIDIEKYIRNELEGCNGAVSFADVIMVSINSCIDHGINVDLAAKIAMATVGDLLKREYISKTEKDDIVPKMGGGDTDEKDARCSPPMYIKGRKFQEWDM